MRYIIMCGGTYPAWERPRQLIEIHGEPIVARTIRLLREAGVEDIAISSRDPAFEGFGVPVLRHRNDHVTFGYNNCTGYWCDCFFPANAPTCYIFGDVIFSPEAIRTIVDYQTDDIMLFGSAPPFAPEYPKKWIEPFAFKVQNYDHLSRAIEQVKRMDAARMFHRHPIAWEVWAVIRGGNPNSTDTTSYIAINDYTCDIDRPEEAAHIEGGIYAV